MAADHLSRVVSELCLAAAQAGGTLSDSQLLGRFIDQRDQAAFAALVRRHGPIVWGVCRRIVGHHQDSEDAFQATFLVLARKAAVIQPREMLGNWLYGVARRTATKAKSLAEKRRRREKSLATANEPTSCHHETSHGWEPLIDRELARLPEKYRIALILCDLQNKTGKDAATLLKIPEGTLSSRLRTARDLLAKRLARHGLPLVREATALILSQELAKAAVPRAARLAVIKAAPAIAAGQALTACSVSPAVIVLTEGVLNIMWISKAKIIMGAVLAMLIVGTGGFVSLRTMAVAQTGEKAVAQAQREQPAARDDVHGVSAKAGEPAQTNKPLSPESKEKGVGAAKKSSTTDQYGDPLPKGAVARLGTVRYRPGSPLSATAISLDGRLLAGWESIGIQIWDAESGKPLRVIPGGLRNGFGAIAFSPDNKVLACYGNRFGSNGTKLLCYDVTTGKILKQCEPKPDEQGNALEKKGGGLAKPFLAFLPGGKKLLFKDEGPTLRLFDVTSGAEVRAFPAPACQEFAIAPDGKSFAAVEVSGTVRLWEVATGKEQLAINRHTGEIKTIKRFVFNKQVTVVFAPDGKVLATGSQKEGIFLWEVATGKLLVALDAQEDKFPGPIASLSFSPDGKSLVSCHPRQRLGPTMTMVCWDVSTGKEIRRFTASDNGEKAYFLPDGKTLVLSGQVYPTGMASASVNTPFSFLDASNGEPRRLFDGHLSAIKDLAYSPDGSLVATTEEANSGSIRFWEAGSGRLLFKGYDLQGGSPSTLVFSPKGSILVVAYKNKIVLWDVKTGKPARTISAEGQVPIALAISTDGSKLVSCDRDRTIRVRDLASGKELRNFRTGENDPDSRVGFYRNNIAFSSDLRLAATADQGPSTIQIWDLATGKEIKRIERGGRGAIRFVFSPDGRTLLETSGTKFFYLWEVASGQQRRAVPLPAFANSAAYSPNSRFMVLGEMDRSALLGPKASALGIAINIYDVVADHILSPLKGHEGTIACLHFSQDGRTLASGSNDLTGLLWDVPDLAGPRPEVQLTAKERVTCWADLAGTAPVAFASIWMLVGDKETVNLLRENLQPAPAWAGEKEVVKLVVGLASDQFAVRSQAAEELAKLGLAAEAELRKSLGTGLTLETHRRVEGILRSIMNQQLRSVRAIEILESINTQASRRLLESLAKGQDDAWQTREAIASLERLANRQN